MYRKSVAVIGTGFIGPVHVESLQRLGITVKGILGSSSARSQSAAQQMNLAIGYNSLAELLADDDIGTVHITSPNKFHFDQVRAALKAGKHVMCEKPLAMNSHESGELVKLAGSSGLVTGVNYNIRYYPLNVEARVRAAGIGIIHEVSGGYAQDWLLKKEDYNWRVLSEVGGPLRAIGDIGTHWLDLVCFITGKTIEMVYADLYTIHPVRRRPVGDVVSFACNVPSNLEDVTIDTEDGGNVLIRFTDGSRGSLRVSQVAAGRKNRIYYELSGREQSLAWDGENPNRLWIGQRGSPNQEIIKNPAILCTEAQYITNYPGGHAEGFPDSHKQCFRVFYDAIEGRKPILPHPGFDEGHREMLLCEAILQSFHSDGWVRIKE